MPKRNKMRTTMKIRTLSRRPLWLLALPLLSLPAARAQDEPAPADPVEEGVDAAEGGEVDPGAPVEPAAPIEPGVPIDGGGAMAEVPVKAIDTIEFDAYTKSLGGATQLEVDAANVSPAELAQKLAAATGLRVEASPQWEAFPDSKITAKIAKTSLWDALAQLKTRGVDAQWIAPTRTLQLLPLSDAAQAAPLKNPLSLDLGGAQLGVTRVQRTRALSFPAATEAGAKSDRFEVELALRPDPRWRSIDGTASWAGLSLVDAKGVAHPVLTEAAGGTLEGAQAAFDAARVDASGPATLRGEIRFAVVAKSQKWELSDLSKPQQLAIERDGVPVRYEYLGATDANGARSLRFAASNPATAPATVIALPSPDPSVPSANLPLYHFAGVGTSGGLRVQRADSAPLEFLETGSGMQSSERSEFEVQTLPDPANEAAGPAKIEVDLPLEWREVRVPFEIKNVPLP
jgi:hypothetical protein